MSQNSVNVATTLRQMAEYVEKMSNLPEIGEVGFAGALSFEFANDGVLTAEYRAGVPFLYQHAGSELAQTLAQEIEDQIQAALDEEEGYILDSEEE